MAIKAWSATPPVNPLTPLAPRPDVIFVIDDSFAADITEAQEWIDKSDFRSGYVVNSEVTAIGGGGGGVLKPHDR